MTESQGNIEFIRHMNSTKTKKSFFQLGKNPNVDIHVIRQKGE